MSSILFGSGLIPSLLNTHPKNTISQVLKPLVAVPPGRCSESGDLLAGLVEVD